jgi:hypothetical protein
MAFLKRFCQICHLVLTSLDFASIIFSQSKVIGLASNTQPRWPGLCIYVTQWQGGPVISHQHQLPFVAFYDSQGYGGDILTCLYMALYWVPPNWEGEGGVRSKCKITPPPIRNMHNLRLDWVNLVTLLYTVWTKFVPFVSLTSHFHPVLFIITIQVT